LSYIAERQRLRAPRVWLLPVLATLVVTLTFPLYPDTWSVWERNLGFYLTVVWTFPAVMSTVAAMGAVLAWGSIVRSRRDRTRPARSGAFLIIQVPTIGRHDVMPALTRAVQSYVESAPAGFDDWRVDVVAEETSEAIEALDALASHRVRVLYVPADYTTPNGTERKARANHWADALRRREGELRSDVWVLHMDDDTGLAPDTILEVARFIEDNPADDTDAKVFGQGVLTYPRSYAKKLMVWVADSIRPSSDLSFFRAATGSGRPLFGAHGELLLIRADIESTIGWDFGRLLSITEDANFALTFAHRYPGRSGWFPGRCFGSAPESFSDLVTQRKRWCRGLLHVVTNRELPVRVRFVLGYGVATWVLGPFQHVIIILAIAVLFELRYTAPLQQWLLLPWAVHTSIGMWMYLEGMRANRDASHPDDRRWWHYLLLLCYPVLMLIEAFAALKGLIAFVKDRLGRNDGDLFEVIRKTHVEEATGELVGAGSNRARARA
jgi:beta-1,4-mannosyltransferase